MGVLIKKRTIGSNKNLYTTVYLNVAFRKTNTFPILNDCPILTNYQYTLIKDVTFWPFASLRIKSFILI
jgi:hypothetical protein